MLWCFLLAGLFKTVQVYVASRHLTLTGEHLKPDGSMIPWRRPPHHESLIDLRGHFMPELVRLALDL